MPGLVRGVARTAAVVGTATAVSNRVSRRQAGRWAAQDQQAMQQQQQQQQQQQPVYYEQQAPPPPGPPGGMTSEQIAQLKELGQLRDSGVLTEAEFEVQKERILAA